MRLWAVGCCISLSVLGCSQADKNRPPPAPGCTTDCNGGTSGGSSTGSGGSGPGGMGGSSNVGATNVTGTVESLSDDAFTSPKPFTGSATVFGESPKGAQGVSTVYNGTSFALNGVIDSGDAWFAVRSEDTAAWLPTLSFHDTSQASITTQIISLPLLQDLFLSLTTPTQLNLDLAQVVIRVFHSNGVPVPGVTLNSTAGEFVAYSSSGTFSETETVTDAQGVIVLGNVTSTRFPGNDLALSFGGAVKLQRTVRIARGFVSFVNVVVVP